MESSVICDGLVELYAEHVYSFVHRNTHRLDDACAKFCRQNQETISETEKDAILRRSTHNTSTNGSKSNQR
jgi:hypothetical protein